MTASPTSSSPAPEYRLEVGDALFSLRCPQPGLADGLAAWFDRPSVPADAGEPDITLEITVIAHDDQPAFPRSLLTTKRLLGDGAFDISDGLITGRFDPLAGYGTVRVKAALLTGRLTRIFEQVLYQAHSSARADGPAGVAGPLVIGDRQWAGIPVRGAVGLGQVDGGRLQRRPARAGRRDEPGAPADRRRRPLGTGRHPLQRHVPREAARLRPLRAVLLLEHGPRHELDDAAASAAVAVLAGEIVPPVGLDEIPGPGTLPLMVDAAQAIAANTTLKVMRFTPDPGFWKTLEGAFGLPPLS